MFLMYFLFYFDLYVCECVLMYVYMCSYLSCVLFETKNKIKTNKHHHLCTSLFSRRWGSREL